MSGYAVAITTQVIESGALPINILAQKVELVALRQALKLAEREKVNIWTIWKERHLLLTLGSPVKCKEEILMHCKTHQFGQTAVNVGNLLANKTAKAVAEQSILVLASVKQVKLPILKPNYRETGQELASLLKAATNDEGWLITHTKQITVTLLYV